MNKEMTPPSSSEHSPKQTITSDSPRLVESDLEHSVPFSKHFDPECHTHSIIKQQAEDAVLKSDSFQSTFDGGNLLLPLPVRENSMSLHQQSQMPPSLFWNQGDESHGGFMRLRLDPEEIRPVVKVTACLVDLTPRSYLDRDIYSRSPSLPPQSQRGTLMECCTPRRLEDTMVDSNGVERHHVT